MAKKEPYVVFCLMLATVGFLPEWPRVPVPVVPVPVANFFSGTGPIPVPVVYGYFTYGYDTRTRRLNHGYLYP